MPRNAKCSSILANSTHEQPRTDHLDTSVNRPRKLNSAINADAVKAARTVDTTRKQNQYDVHLTVLITSESGERQDETAIFETTNTKRWQSSFFAPSYPHATRLF